MVFVALTVVVVMGFLPGYLLVCCLPDAWTARAVARRTVLPLSFAFSVIVIANLHFISLSLGEPDLGLNLGLYLAVVSALGAYTRIRRRPLLTVDRIQTATFGTWLVYLVILLMFTPSYETAYTSDWLFYFPNTEPLLGRISLDTVRQGWRLDFFAKRTPYLSLYGAFFHTVLGHSYALFQVISLLENGLSFFGIYLLADLLFGPRAATLTLLVAPLAPAVIRGLINPEPKTAGTFFLFLSMYYYLCTRPGAELEHSRLPSALAGVFACAAFMYHPSMLFYLVGIYLDQLYLGIYRKRKFDRVLGLSTIAAVLLLVAPWYLWLWANLGAAAAFGPSTTISRPLSYTAFEYAYTRLTMITSSIVIPFNFVVDLGAARPFWPDSPATIVMWTQMWGDHIIRFYEEAFVASMTLASSVVLVIFGWRARPREPGVSDRSPLYVWMGIGALLSFAVHVGIVDNKGHTRNLMTPLLLATLCYVGRVLSTLRPVVVAFFFAVASFELMGTRLLIYVVSLPRAGGLPSSVYQESRDWLSRTGLIGVLVFLGLLALAYVFGLRRLEQSVAASQSGFTPAARRAPAG